MLNRRVTGGTWYVKLSVEVRRAEGVPVPKFSVQMRPRCRPPSRRSSKTDLKVTCWRGKFCRVVPQSSDLHSASMKASFGRPLPDQFVPTP